MKLAIRFMAKNYAGLSAARILNQATGQALTRSFIRHPGIAVIVPFWNADSIILLRQYRYAINDELWELPAGTLAGREENHRIAAAEGPEICAARELIEETGFAANQLEKLQNATRFQAAAMN